ncbi:MAG: DUF1361 domain-containing protein, partial [Bacteroidales bacterium]|nr:DUF1361 domain-containing protein [Bacteroidales bacterium]
MWRKLRETNRLKETAFLGILSLFCFCFSIFRYIYSDTYVFLFLNWNLFLAFIPWALTTVSIMIPKIRKSKITIVILVCTWLLFFPNAPYILTDL